MHRNSIKEKFKLIVIVHRSDKFWKKKDNWMQDTYEISFVMRLRFGIYVAQWALFFPSINAASCLACKFKWWKTEMKWKMKRRREANQPPIQWTTKTVRFINLNIIPCRVKINPFLSHEASSWEWLKFELALNKK